MDWIVGLAIFGTLASICDIFWVLRVFFTRFQSLFERKRRVDEEFFLYSICSTTDIDFYIHMNNGKYFRELDFARCDFYFRTGLTTLFFGPRAILPIFKKFFGSKDQEEKYYIVQHGAMIRYRRPIPFLMPFVVKTKLVYFDKRSLYFEQSFISKPDNFVRAVAFSKNTVVNCPDLIGFMKKTTGMVQPECPTELVKFIEADEISSNKLKAERIDEFFKTK